VTARFQAVYLRRSVGSSVGTSPLSSIFVTCKCDCYTQYLELLDFAEDGGPSPGMAKGARVEAKERPGICTPWFRNRASVPLSPHGQTLQLNQTSARSRPYAEGYINANAGAEPHSSEGDTGPGTDSGSGTAYGISPPASANNGGPGDKALAGVPTTPITPMSRSESDATYTSSPPRQTAPLPPASMPITSGAAPVTSGTLVSA
jgi:hypothetical protein